MNEFKLHDENNKTKFLQRLANVDWVNYMLPQGSTKGDIDAIAKIWKFWDLYNKLINPGKNPLKNHIKADGTLKIPLFLYDSSYELTTSERFRKTCIKLELRMREVFSIDSVLIDINTFFNLIDNEEGLKDIYSNKNLRATRFQMCEKFYDDLIKFFLNLMVDFYYNVNTMEISFYTLEECSLKAAEIILFTKEQFEKGIQKDFWGGLIIDEIETHLPDLKTEWKPKRKYNKKDKLTAEEK